MLSPGLTVRRRRMGSCGVHAAFLAVAALVIGGCGSSSSPSKDVTATQPATLLNTVHVAHAIEKSIRDQRNVKAKVTCPPAIVQKKDQNFVCIATTKKYGTTRFAVTQKDDAGSVTYAAAK